MRLKTVNSLEQESKLKDITSFAVHFQLRTQCRHNLTAHDTSSAISC